jgi:hypothetical protein
MNLARNEVISKVNELEKKLGRRLKILDLGGGFFPFALATHIVDIITYEEFLKVYNERSYNPLGVWGSSNIRFSKETWIIHNISAGKPLPFADTYFDFCVCCHVLEDLVNPFFAVQEITRVAKAGYIEMPSKEVECTLGIDGILSGKYTGFNHHFWMYSQNNDALIIEPKYSFLGASPAYHFSKGFKKKWIKTNREIVSYFWNEKINLRIVATSLFEDLRIRQKEYIKSIKGNSLSSIFLDIYQYLKKKRNEIRSKTKT